MKILFYSYAFAPSVGGIETVGGILAEQFVRLGSTVTVVTHTPGEPVSAGYEIVRRPSLGKLRQLAQFDYCFSEQHFLADSSPPALLPEAGRRGPSYVADTRQRQAKLAGLS